MCTTTSTTEAPTAPTILVTGGCGFIASHTLVCLLQAPENYNVVIVDNLVNSSSVSLDRVAKIVNLTDEERQKRLVFHNVDMRNEAEMKKVFENSPKFSACIHFAGLKVCVENYFHSIIREIIIDF